MNVSVHDWPGWYRMKMGEEGFRCWLNGAEIGSVIAADEDHGFVIVIRRDQNGQPLLNREKTRVRTKTLRGTVRLERLPL